MTIEAPSRVAETTTTSGTGTIDLDGAITTDPDGNSVFFFAFGDKVASGSTVRYIIQDGSQFESGYGTFTSGSPDTLSRDTVKESSETGSAKITLSGNEATVFADIRGEDTFATDENDKFDARGKNVIGVASVNDGPLAGFRNIIVNGDMRVSQRGSQTGLTSSAYGETDRFELRLAGSVGTWDFTQETDAPSSAPSAKSLKVEVTSANSSLDAGDSAIIAQSIEGQNLQALLKGSSAAKSLTISFWVKSSQTGTFIIELLDQDNLRTISGSYTINSADTWERKELTFLGDTTGALDSDSNKSLDVNFFVAAGPDRTSGTLATSWQSKDDADRAVGQTDISTVANATFQLTAVQLEIGDRATPFEQRPIATELTLCERYFEIINVINQRNDNAKSFRIHSINFRTRKRTSPSVSYTLSKGSNDSVEADSTYIKIVGESDSNGELKFEGVTVDSEL